MLDCLVNGGISAYVPASDRGLHYGDGVFETIAVFNGSPRFWQAHMDRLAAGCAALGLRNFAQPVWFREVQTVSAGRARCVVKLILTRGSSGRGYAPAADASSTRVVCAYDFPDQAGTLAETGITARICNLRLAIQPALAGIKHLNRLEQVMARAEWSDPRVHEGILLDPEDHVVCATAGNIFLVSGDRLLTPRMDRCGVRGVLRGAILKAFEPRCEQRRILLDMLPEADEVFICNAVRGILPVTRIGNWEYGLGAVTREVQRWLETR